MAKKRLLDIFRKSQHSAEYLRAVAAVPARTQAGTEEQYTYKEYQRVAIDAIRQLPPKQRELFELYNLEEKSLDEIVAQTGLAKAAVKKNIYRARLFIRQYLQKHGEWLPVFLLINVSFFKLSRHYFYLELPDRTKVWLNAASSISYPNAFVGTGRKVEVTGEAYFEVAKNKEKPFIATVNGTAVRALGTRFNIIDYFF